MLKVALAASFVLALAASARASDDLVVGVVIDRDGAAVVAADVRAYDARNREIGRDATDTAGTFAVHVAKRAASLEVRCRYCRTERVAVGERDGELVISVVRYGALADTAPSEADFEDLPYGRVADVLALTPFVLPTRDGSVSDRGLALGTSLTLDNGAPLADVSTGSTAFADEPERAVRRVAITPATSAFRYGPGAGGGSFALDTLPNDASAVIDAGPATALAFGGVAGDLRPAAALSNDANFIARRAEIDDISAFAGGLLRVGVTSGSEAAAPSDRQYGFARNVAIAHASYATSSRRYRTFAALSLADVALAFAPPAGTSPVANDAYRSTYASASFRVEKPGPVELDFGTVATMRQGSYDANGTVPYDLVGHASDATAYVEAHVEGPTSVDAGIGVLLSSEREALTSARPSGTDTAMLPSLDVRRDLGGGAYLRTGYSQSSRTPTLLERASAPSGAGGFERGELLESALGYDDGRRLRGEAIAYREYRHEFAETRLDGIGASVTWQVTPRLSLRAWTLRATPFAFADSLAAAPLDATRGVAWLSYENAERVRIDALAVRDAGGTQRGTSLDGDVIVPLRARVSLALDTARRDNVRRYGVGLRLR